MTTFDPLRTAADAQIDQLIEVHRDRIATLGLERAEGALVTDVMATPDTALEALVGRYVLMANRLASTRTQEVAR